LYDQIPWVPVRTVMLDVDGRFDIYKWNDYLAVLLGSTTWPYDIYKGNDYFAVPLGSTTWPYSMTEIGTCVRDISNGAKFVILLEQLNYSLL